MLLKVIFVIVSLCKCSLCDFDLKSQYYDLSLVLQWKTLRFNWPDKNLTDDVLIRNKTFIPQNNFLRDFRLWHDSAFLTVPRWRSGIPATLAKIPITSLTDTSSPLLEAFPSWPMQKLNDCFAFQNVHSVEIDWQDRLWVLDSGIVDELEEQARILCPPKLVIIDLKTNFIVKTASIPVSMVRNGSQFTCMTLDKDGGVAFIADSNSMDSGFVVYNYKESSFKRMECDQMNLDEELSPSSNIPKALVPQFVALSLNTDRNKLYFSTYDSNDLFYVNVSVFDKNVSDVSMYAENMGTYGRSVEIIADNMGYMYFDVLNYKAVAQWRESSWVFQYTPHVVVQSQLFCGWISALDVDKDGYLWIVSSRFREYANGRFRPEKENFRVFRMFVPRKEKPRKPKTGFNAEYAVLVLFIVIIGLIISELLMFNSD